MLEKVAIIVWAGGQDGKILTELLTRSWYGIVAISRQSVQYIGVNKGNECIDILNTWDVTELVKECTPDALYYLAAYHHSSQEELPNDRELYQKSREVHVDGYLNFLEAIVQYSPHTSVCYASSCLIYEWSESTIQDEQTLPVPMSPYAITKLEWMHLGNWYTKKYGLSIVNAILYNHESEFRRSNFLSMKVILGAIAISQWKQNELILGDLSTKIDQGSAWDYVCAMIWLVENRHSGDYIISSGEQHTIQDMVEIVFGHLWLDWEKYVRGDPNIVKRKTGILFWNPAKIKENISWQPEYNFGEMLIKTISILC